MSIAVMFKVGKREKHEAEDSSNCWRVGPQTILIVVSFFFQTPKNTLLKSFSWQLILYYFVICFVIFLTFHFVSPARLPVHSGQETLS